MFLPVPPQDERNLASAAAKKKKKAYPRWVRKVYRGVVFVLAIGGGLAQGYVGLRWQSDLAKRHDYAFLFDYRWRNQQEVLRAFAQVDRTVKISYFFLAAVPLSLAGGAMALAGKGRISTLAFVLAALGPVALICLRLEDGTNQLKMGALLFAAPLLLAGTLALFIRPTVSSELETEVEIEPEEIREHEEAAHKAKKNRQILRHMLRAGIAVGLITYVGFWIGTLAGGLDQKSPVFHVIRPNQQIQCADQATVISLSTSHDGKSLLLLTDIRGQKRNVELWDLAKRKKIHEFEKPFALIGAIAISPDGKIAAYRRMFGSTISLRHLSTKEELGDLPQERDANTASLDIRFSRSGDFIVASHDNQIIGWDVATRRQRFGWQSDEQISSLSPIFADDKKIVSAGANGSVTVWELETGKSSKIFQDDQLQIGSLALSPDGKLLAGARFLGTVKIWNMEQGKLVREISLSNLLGDSLVFLDNDNLLFPVADHFGREELIMLYNVPTEKARSWLVVADPVEGAHACSLAFAAGSSRLTSSCGNNKVYLWELGKLRGKKGDIPK
jgi:hypothetical protein